MEVTRNNFESVFPEIVQDIEKATFLCIDGEFTGLNNGLNINAFDTPAESYQKIRDGSMDFLFIQFGLSIFTQDGKTGKYKNKTYVFYLFPRQFNRHTRDVRFLCQASSIDFLVTNNFDFNKLFKEGIPYLNSSDESSIAEILENRRTIQANIQKDNSARTSIAIPKPYKQTVDNAMKKIEKVVKGTEGEVKITGCSSFLRKLIYQTFEERYGSPEDITLKSENGAMVCRRGKEIEGEERDAKELSAAVGFSRVIREISSKGKLVVGHNMILDICHLIHRFLDPLPEDYHMFKEMAHSLFPRLVDTKLLCSEEPIRDLLPATTLESLLDTFSKPPFNSSSLVEETENYNFSGVNGQLHNAGYDALITGKVFLSLIRALDPDNKFCRLSNCKPLEKHMNKLFLMKAPDTCIDLVNPDPEPRRDHVFHITFPSCWTSTNIVKTFSSFVKSTIHIIWLSDTTAWVSLHQREDSVQLLKALESTSQPSGVTIIPYHRFMREKGAATSPRPNKRKSSEPETVVEEKKRRSGSLCDNRNGSIRRISPIPEEVSSEEKGSGIQSLEEAANFNGDEFGENSSWD